jgi:hypothetical protein
MQLHRLHAAHVSPPKHVCPRRSPRGACRRRRRFRRHSPRRQKTQATQCRALRPPRFEQGEWPQTCCPPRPAAQEVTAPNLPVRKYGPRACVNENHGGRIFWVGGVVVRILVILADVFLLEAPPAQRDLRRISHHHQSEFRVTCGIRRSWRVRVRVGAGPRGVEVARCAFACVAIQLTFSQRRSHSVTIGTVRRCPPTSRTPHRSLCS